MAHVKKGPKIVLYLVGAGAIFYGVNYAVHNLLPQPPQQVSRAVTKVETPDLPREPIKQQKAVQAQPIALPAAPQNGPLTVRCEIMAWNSQAGLILANGGAITTPGSLVAANGSSLQLIHQDDVSQMQRDVIAFANTYANGNPQPTNGVPCILVMWDGSPGTIAGANEALSHLGKEYGLKMIGSVGFSRGEDKFMGPQKWKDNPLSMKGGVIIGYIGDGDWNIAMKFIGDNSDCKDGPKSPRCLCNNPDTTSYDPNCVNWIAADDYIDAVKKYNAGSTGYCEDRKIVGSLGSKHICGEGVVTWTPGDVMVAQGRGGLVSIMSTYENYWQMPNAMLVIDKYAKENRANFEGILDAAFQAGDMIKNDDMQLRRAASLSAQVYEQQDADYWYKYFRIVQETDSTGLKISLGGSAVNDLSDNLYIYGLATDSTDVLTTIYKTFGNLLVNQYPDKLASFVPADQVIDSSYIINISKRQHNTAKPLPSPDVAPITQTTRIKTKVADKSYSIQFVLGKATLSPEAESTLQEVLTSLTVSGNLAVRIVGHTDSSASDKINQPLSEARAFAVKDWLQQHGKGLTNIQHARAEGRGASEPMVPNDTAEHKAQNRRVEIVLGTAD